MVRPLREHIRHAVVLELVPMVTDGAMVERWFFYQDVAGLWKWARLDVLGAILAHSGSSFATRDDCTDDARQNGYAEQHRREIGRGLGRSRSGESCDLHSNSSR